MLLAEHQTTNAIPRHWDIKSIETRETSPCSTTYRPADKVSKSYLKNFWIFVFIAIVIVGDQITLSTRSLAGVYANALALVLLIGLALWKKQARMLAISASILPAANMVNLALPQNTVLAQTVVFYSSLLILALVYRFMFALDQPIEKSKLGKRGYLTILPLMILVGQLLGVIGYFMLRHHYSFSITPLPLLAACSIIFAFTEETFFRGLIQQQGSMVLNPALAALLSLIVFTSATIGHVTILSPLFALIAGLVLVTTYFKKQNLILTITINAVAKLVYIGLVAGVIIFH